MNIKTKPNYGWMFFPFAVFLLTRGMTFISAYLFEVSLPSPDDAIKYWHIAPDNLFVDVMARFDSGFYITIVKDGYSWNPGEMSNTVFFPLYPLLIRLLNPQTDKQVGMAGILLSNFFLFATLLILYQLVILEWDDHSSARRTVFYMAIAPASFFFSSVYTESLFLFLSVGFFYAIRRQYWTWAVLMGMLMGATRIQGILALPVLLLAWANAQGWSLRGILSAQAWRSLWQGLRSQWAQFLLLFLTPSLLVSHYIFLYHYFPFINYKALASTWGHRAQMPWNVLYQTALYLRPMELLAGRLAINPLFELPMIFFALLMIFFAWKKLGEIYGIFILLSVLLPLITSTGSFLRYEMVVFPITMMLGLWGKSETVDRIIVVISLLAQAVGMAIHVNWIFFM